MSTYKKDYKKENRNNYKKSGKENDRQDFIEIDGETDKIEGRNPVYEALKADRTIDKIFIQKGDKEGSILAIIGMAKQKGIVVQEVEKAKLDQITLTKSHQGVIALASMTEYVEVEDILKIAKDKEELPFIIILDEITDPHNLGSIIRTANAVGAHGVIIPKRRSVGVNAIVSKTSAGATQYVPIAKVSNIAQTIDKLKEEGIWVFGADMSGEKPIYDSDLKGSIALVVGSEGEGIGKLVKQKCDFLVQIPMMGEISSLNASVAAAVMMYEVLRQRIKTKN